MLTKPKKPKNKQEKKLQGELNKAFSFVRAAFIADKLGIPHKYNKTRYEYCHKFINKCQKEGMLPWWSEDEDNEIKQQLFKLVQNLHKS